MHFFGKPMPSVNVTPHKAKRKNEITAEQASPHGQRRGAPSSVGSVLYPTTREHTSR
ncbi:protein of unknown function [Candidatus Filomicrobium marinum]|uniref:Uncharacterized protein n=1 Tax=Candidatus Filomicrobium marinum TaxID=1608628 RepID=A0A0D6JBK4_9HYPH|nr:protein of unknown function [Candidatus Filomicrobium marinum]CPR16243.1 protein of unknown function [Candidatus Filomicrobium marinum]